MSDKTGIEWTDATWNPVTGCAKVSAGCKHCYAERNWGRLSANPKTVYYGREFTDVQCHPERLDQPLRWQKPRMIFVNSMSDLFHESVPDEFIDQVFAVMALAEQHTFQVLTKRPERMLEYVNRYMDSATPLSAFAEWASDMANIFGGYDTDSKYDEFVSCGWPLPNVWLGVTVENQEAADGRIPLLLQTPAAVRWVSVEPMLGVVDLVKAGAMGCDCPSDNCMRELRIARCTGNCAFYKTSIDKRRISWCVAGGESGKNARPMHPDWVRSLRDQCDAAGVPFLFKQWGEWSQVRPVCVAHPCFNEKGRFAEYWRMNSTWFYTDSPNGLNLTMHFCGRKTAGRLLDGRTWDDYPKGIYHV